MKHLDLKEFDRIVEDLYSAAAGRSDWRDPLGRIAAAVNVRRIRLFAVSKNSNGALLSSHFGGAAKPEAELAYIRTYHRTDPRLRLLLTFDASRWLHCHEHFDDDFVVRDPFYQDFLIPYGTRYASLTKLVEDDSTVVIFAAMCGIGGEPLGATELNYLQRIKTHLTRAMEIHQLLHVAYTELATGRELLNQFRYPMILIDDQRQIRLSNHAAVAFLTGSECVVDRHGVLGCRRLRDETKLSAAVQSLDLSAAADCASTAPDKAFLKMRRVSDGGPLAVHVIAIRPQASVRVFGTTPLALLVFYDPRSQAALDPFIVAETFNLTPAEARVAVNIARGRTLEQIASDIGVSLATVRSQLQAVFRKTNVNRQSDLMRVLTGIAETGLVETTSTRRPRILSLE